MRKILLSFFMVLFLLCGNVLAQSTTSTSLTFQWDSNTETNLGGYGFYVGDAAEGPYDLTEDNIPKSPTNTVTFTIPDVVVTINEPTFFVVDAFNTEGQRSGYSVPCQYIHCMPLADETRVEPCPTGFTGAGINQKRTSSCTPNSYPTWSAWIEVSKACTAQVACQPGTTTRQVSCGDGYSGSITETRTITCPSTYGTPVDSGWVETSRNCTALTKCVVPAPRSETLSCGEGFSGSITRTQTATCPDTYGSPVWGNVVEQRNCTALPKCTVPAPIITTQPCGVGFEGTITKTQTATCPASGYGLPTWGPVVESRNCTALTPCVAPAPITETLSCGEGFSGSITKTRTATCPDPYGTPTWNEVVNNTCKALPLCVESTDSRSLSCPTGQTGNIIETRSSTCPDKYGSPVWSPWSPTSNTCVNNETTCTPTTETRKSRCEKWYYKGSTVYVRTKVCNPDGTYTWTDWTLQSNTCRPWWIR